MTLVHILEGALLGVLLEYFRVRRMRNSAVRALQQIKEEQAATVAAALSNSVMIDGVELPKPDDDRWKLEQKSMTSKLHGDSIETMLVFGRVHVNQVPHDLYVDTGAPMTRTEHTQKYCSDVWKAYRSRVARKAIESTT